MVVCSSPAPRHTPECCIQVERDAFPIPTITINARPLVTFPRTATISVVASATLASCFSGAQLNIDFQWTNLAATASTSSAPAELIVLGDSSLQRTLALSGATLRPRVTYVISVSGCISKWSRVTYV